MRTKTAASVIILLFAVLPLYAETRVAGRSLLSDNPELVFWYQMIGTDAETVIASAGSRGFGGEPVEISPSEVGSRVDRIIYINGLTVWFIGDKTAGSAVQLRLDSTVKGTAAGLGIGSAPAEVRQVFGNPWIESDGSLYYNLPWRGAPVRLRFVFEETGRGSKKLIEVYLYQVR